MSYFYVSDHECDAKFTHNLLLPELSLCSFFQWKGYTDALSDSLFPNGVLSAINRSSGVIVIMSKSSMSCQNVKFEWGYAQYIEKPVFPIMVESPETISIDGTLKVVYDVHDNLARERWYNFSDCAHLQWDNLKLALFEATLTDKSGIR